MSCCPNSCCPLPNNFFLECCTQQFAPPPPPGPGRGCRLPAAVAAVALPLPSPERNETKRNDTIIDLHACFLTHLFFFLFFLRLFSAAPPPPPPPPPFDCEPILVLPPPASPPPTAFVPAVAMLDMESYPAGIFGVRCKGMRRRRRRRKKKRERISKSQPICRLIDRSINRSIDDRLARFYPPPPPFFFSYPSLFPPSSDSTNRSASTSSFPSSALAFRRRPTFARA